MSSAPAVTDSSFDKDVLQSDLPVLVDFGHLMRSMQDGCTAVKKSQKILKGKLKFLN